MNRKILFIACICLFLNSGVNSQHKYDTPPSDFFYIKSAQMDNQNRIYWDQPGVPDNFDKGVDLLLNIKENTTDQHYRFVAAGEGYYYIQSKNGGLADVSGNRKENGTRVMMWRGHGGTNQLFRFRHLGEGRWKIYAKNCTLVCTAKGSTGDLKIHVWEDHDGEWTEWYFENFKTGKIYLPGSKKK